LANRIPEQVLKEGQLLGVPDGALLSAWEAYEVVYREGILLGETPLPGEKADRLRAWGGDGFRAVVAILRTGLDGGRIPILVQAAWCPGEEEALLCAAEDPAIPPFARVDALEAMGIADSVRTRDYLAERILREEDPDAFAGVAFALGELHEPRGWERVASKLGERTWDRRLRKGLAYDLVWMNRDAAPRALYEAVRDPECDIGSCIAWALFIVDRELAASAAALVLASPRRESCSELDLESLRDIVRRFGR
jgi:hypothetical protein